MNFLRIDLLRRGRTSADDVEQQNLPSAVEVNGEPAQPEMQERPISIASRFTIGRASMPRILSFRASSNLDRPAVAISEGEIESPKTPRFTLGMPNLPSTRLHLPHLARTWTSGSNGPASRPPTARPPTGRPSESEPRPLMRVLTDEDRSPIVTPPEAVAQAMREQERARLHRFDGPDPAERHLAQLAEDGRRRSRRRRRGAEDTRQRERPKRFLFCFPWVRSRRVRTQILRCFVSGMFLLMLLTIYLALSITKNINNSEFTVLLILVILFTTIFFCHGLIRLCMLLVRPRNEQSRHHLPQFMGPGGYAVPREPIRVVLARDEEAAGVTNGAAKHKPPAYGLWRESVRVDPNRLFWQRNDDAPQEEESGSSSSSIAGNTGARPPSYISDDGVNYVVEAQPRSTAPTTDVPLPVHPSEIGRVGERPSW